MKVSTTQGLIETERTMTETLILDRYSGARRYHRRNFYSNDYGVSVARYKDDRDFPITADILRKIVMPWPGKFRGTAMNKGEKMLRRMMFMRGRH